MPVLLRLVWRSGRRCGRSRRTWYRWTLRCVPG